MNSAQFTPNASTSIDTTRGTIARVWDRIDGRRQMAWWLFPVNGGERRCLGLTEHMSAEDAVFAATGVRPISEAAKRVAAGIA